MDAVNATSNMGDMFHPPLMVQPSIAITPFAGVDLANISQKIGEIEPVVAVAGNRARVAPIVVALAVGSKMDVANLCLPGILLVVAYEALPEIVISVSMRESFFHD